ncbi:hypothetical protein [Kribbella steppae]|uniref:hypothetical protein n=1 Tax=Kribbella steppae TaxID=2512223 RepID=UPI00104AAB90|nr:hypothetical protein [Kribbella steppae]
MRGERDAFLTVALEDRWQWVLPATTVMRRSEPAGVERAGCRPNIKILGERIGHADITVTGTTSSTDALGTDLGTDREMSAEDPTDEPV